MKREEQIEMHQKSNKSALIVQNLNVFYGQLQALKDISLDVFRGEVVTLLGGNGAGKSTLLQTISGILHGSSGEITFYGDRISNMVPEKIVKMGLSQVPERRRLFDSMSVMDNLLLGTYSLDRKRRKADLEKSLERVFELFPILKVRQNYAARNLSGGEQQMVAIARGLMSKPKALLLDEPSLGLAPLLVKSIMEVIAQLPREGRAVLLVEQNARAALKIASRGYVLQRGKIVLEGNSDELSENKIVFSAYLSSERRKQQV